MCPIFYRCFISSSHKLVSITTMTSWPTTGAQRHLTVHQMFQAWWKQANIPTEFIKIQHGFMDFPAHYCTIDERPWDFWDIWGIKEICSKRPESENYPSYFLSQLPSFLLLEGVYLLSPGLICSFLCMTGVAGRISHPKPHLMAIIKRISDSHSERRMTWVWQTFGERKTRDIISSILAC